MADLDADMDFWQLTGNQRDHHQFRVSCYRRRVSDLAWHRAVRARQRREYRAAVGLVAVLAVFTALVVHLGGGS